MLSQTPTTSLMTVTTLTTLSAIKTTAADLDLVVHMHVHETAGEVEDAVKAGGPRCAQLEPNPC